MQLTDSVVARDIENASWSGWPSWISTRSRQCLRPNRRYQISARSTSATGPRLRRRLDLIAPLVGWEALTRARSSSSELDLPAWMPLRSTVGTGRTARPACSRRCFPINPAGAGKSRLALAAEVEAIVRQTISEHFLRRQQRTVRSASLEVARRCREAQLRAPNANTFRVWIAAIPPRERQGRRSHRKAAVDQFAPRPGVFDSAQRTLDLVQIEHTKLDIIVVRGRR
jgi:hypothetical protein